MSRVGKKPIDIIDGVEVKVDKTNLVAVKGPKGSVSKQIHPNIKVNIEKNRVLVQRPDDKKINKSLHGLSRALINNMVIGVTKGFEKKLLIEGVGFKAAKEGKDIVLSLGFSHTVKVNSVDGITIDLGKKGEILISGVEKDLVGQVAANIRSLKKPDPYKGKGIRYFDEIIVKKVGKSGSAGK